MPLLYKNRIEIPDSLSREIRKICLDRVGQYDRRSHTFGCPAFLPSQGRYDEIREILRNRYEIDSKEVMGITRQSLGATVTDAVPRSMTSVEVLGQNALGILSHIRISEVGSTTDLLYLGDRKFFVVDTTRSTILPDDVLEARGQLKKGSDWEFTIYRNGRKFIDEAFARVKTDAWFKTGIVHDVELFEVPEIDIIIDECEVKGGRFIDVPVVEQTLVDLIAEVRMSLEKTLSEYPEYFDDYRTFPEYNNLLAFSKQHGVGTYVLNLIAQRVEKNERHSYVFVADDWHEHITEIERERIHQEEIRRKRQNHKNYEQSFKEKLDSIKVKKVLLGLFEQDGSIADEAEMESLIRTLEKDIEDIELKGAVKILTPRTDYAEALKNSRRSQKKNIINGTIAGAIVVATVFIALTWTLTKKGAAAYYEAVATVPSLIEDTRYEEAYAALETAHADFSPSYMRFTIMGGHKKLVRCIESAIDSDVQNGIEQIKTILKATHGRFDRNTEEMLFRLLQLCPENEDLLELKEKWKRN